MKKFPGKGQSTKKDGHKSPMQKKNWIKGMERDEVTGLLTKKITSSASWSGDEDYYLEMHWYALQIVLSQKGYDVDLSEGE